MNPLLIGLFIYLICWFLLHPYKRKIYKDTIINIGLFTKYYNDYSIIKKIIMMGLLFSFPLLGHYDNISMPVITEHYSVLHQKPYQINGQKYNESKIFWKLFFKKHNIPSPKTALIKQNGKVIYKNNKILNNEQMNLYVLKPEIGQSANGIIIEPLNQLLKKAYDNSIIEEFTTDCYIEKEQFRKFRIITLYTGEVILVKEVISHNKMVSANILKTEITKCKDTNCSHLTEKEQDEIEEAKQTLAYIHKTKLQNQFSIGWDVLFDCNKYTVIEGNGGGHGLVGVDMKYYKKHFYGYLDNQVF